MRVALALVLAAVVLAAGLGFVLGGPHGPNCLTDPIGGGQVCRTGGGSRTP